MKKYLIAIVVGLMLVATVYSQNNKSMNYTDSWKKVEKYEKQSLPKSAAEEVDKIMKRAIADKNSPQVIKALIHQAEYRLVIDREDDIFIFDNLIEMIAKSEDMVEKSVLHSMLGELYLQYYQNDSWGINQRTNLGDFIPEDMKEWTRNIFFNKVVEHLNASVDAQEELINERVANYEAVISLRKTSREYFPTMYDFLSRRRIDNLENLRSDKDLSSVLVSKNIEIKQLFDGVDNFIDIDFNPLPTDYNLWAFEAYKDFASSLKSRGMDNSLLLMELDRLRFMKSKLPDYHELHSEKYLKRLIEKYSDNPMVVELVDYLSSELRYKNVEDEKTEELYNLLKTYIAKYPNYDRIGLLENKLTEIVIPKYTISGNNTFTIKGEKKFEISYRNLSSVKLKLFSIESSAEVVQHNYNYRSSQKPKGSFVKDIDLSLQPKEEYEFYNAEFTIDIDKPGVYYLVVDDASATAGERESIFSFSVSDLAVFSRALSGNQYEFFVVNRTTGKPIKGAMIDIYKLPGSWSNSVLVKEKSVATDSIGLAKYRKNIPNYDVYYHATLGDDNGAMLVRLPSSSIYRNHADTVKRNVENIFTDRGIYRPGQVVHFKAIATSTKGEQVKLQTNSKIDFVLRDANNREISKQSLFVNEFGSVSGEFVLPTDALNGLFSVGSSNGRVHFRVEEYKRPTFDIQFDKIAQAYSFGEEVTLRGKAESFSGINLQGATVKYRITRQQMMWRMWGGSAEQFAEGEVMTNNEGGFEIVFTPERADASMFARQIYAFAIEATVTDINGETQSSEYTVVVGDVSMILSLDIRGELEKNSNDKIIISATNLDGEKIDAKGEYQIYSLLENDSINKQVAAGSFEVGEQKQIKEQLQKLPSGKYRIKLQSKDDQDREATAEGDVILYSYSDTKPPIKTNDWMVVKNTSLSRTKPGEIIFGASEKVSVLYELWQENNLLERKWIELNNENRTFTFPYKEAYRNGITLMLNYVKDEKFYSRTINMITEEEKRELNITLDVFRDKITPGAKEEWRISVKDGKGNPTIAEVLASMYDISLDKIYQTPEWVFNPYARSSYWSRVRLNIDGSDLKNQLSGQSKYKYKDYNYFEFDFFNWHGLSLSWGSSRILTRSGGVMSKEMLYSAAPILQNAEAQDMMAEEETVVMEDDRAEVNQMVNDNIRRNFDETAFFFPKLVTNAKGERQISFTVPDTNTKWRFRLLAHDKNLNTGKAEAITMSQKDLMVTPNMPRFVRHGDKTSISTKISNLSDVDINGVVTIEFFNPVSDEVINISIADQQEQEFAINQGESTDVSWLFDVPHDIDMLGVRIVARSEHFSDGEQHALAVLPNRMLVTESIRMDVDRNQDKSFAFDRLLNSSSSDSRQDYRLTLEFTTNPAWYAVQSLPVLSTPDTDNSVSWFAAYYANKLGYHIGEAYPKVSAMVDAWKKQGGTTETLLSNLEKNQELKNIILEETPWVMEADNETEQKQKLSLLFDINRSENITNKAIEQLEKLQTYQGGWSWFEGFRPNVGITQYILYGFSQLSNLGIENDDKTTSMISSAIEFIDDEALDRFEAMKRYNKSWKDDKSISTLNLEYLYVRSLYSDYNVDDKLTEMMDFYSSVIENHWTGFSLYERSLIAIILNKQGNLKIVNDIIKSYREHATISDEMGMYWANNRANVFMSQSAVSVHTFIMEAFKEVGASTDEMDSMKKWLLKQKQTQQWESTHATLDAVYALLSMGSDWFASNGETNITLGGETVQPANKDLGTGYIKESWSKTEIKPEMGNVVVSQRGNTPAWGAMYLQYFEDLDRIAGNDASLDVKKELFVEQTDLDGRKLMKINSEEGLKIGDRVVVRLTVRTDRDMDFVHIKDMRASCFEPVNQISGVKWDGGVIYYQSPKDASTNYFFDLLPRGTYVFEYQVVVNRSGEYSNGITTIQSMYAPEFTSHTGGIRINVKR